MSLVTITFGSGAPIALVPSNTPLHEYSLKDLSSSWPMSVTTPTFSVLVTPLGAAEAVALPHGPPPPKRPQALTTRPAINHSAKRRFIYLVRPPSIRRAGARRGDSRSGEHAPQDVTNEHNVEAAAEHERRERQRVLACPKAELHPDQEPG